MLNLAENRKYPRMAIDCGITYRYLEGESAADEVESVRQAVAKNISGNGMLFVADEEPEIGALLEIKIQPGTLSIPTLDALVEVIRVNPGRQRAAEVGVYGNNSHRFEVAALIKSMK